jgi:hypothetical protein
MMEGSGSALLTSGSDPGGPKTLDPIQNRIRNSADFNKEKSRIFGTISGLREDPNPYQIPFWITSTPVNVLNYLNIERFLQEKT